jgi:hypothetical protein
VDPGNRRPVVAALALAVFHGVAAPAAALRIAYAATDLPDPGPEDLWQLDYLVSEGAFAAGQGFSILFPIGDADALAPVATGGGAAWDVLAIQPDPGLPADGLFDAQARVDDATLGFPFSVRFHWRGSGPPGAQAFLVYDPDFVTIETGETVPVPEPGAALLLVIGAAGLARRATRPGRTPRCPRRRTAGS